MADSSGKAISIEVEGIRYASARLAAQALGLGCSTVSVRAHSDKWPSYRWLGAIRPSRPIMTFEERRIGHLLIEPSKWAFDRCERRVWVMDPNFTPPKAVRRVGWLWCLTCGHAHFSDDVVRARLCSGCGGSGGDPIQPNP